VLKSKSSNNNQRDQNQSYLRQEKKDLLVKILVMLDRH